MRRNSILSADAHTSWFSLNDERNRTSMKQQNEKEKENKKKSRKKHSRRLRKTEDKNYRRIEDWSGCACVRDRGESARINNISPFIIKCVYFYASTRIDERQTNSCQSRTNAANGRTRQRQIIRIISLRLCCIQSNRNCIRWNEIRLGWPVATRSSSLVARLFN